MKNIFLLAFLFLASSSDYAFAQLEGRKFISGNLGLGFNNRNPDATKAENDFGYNLDIELGKFKTNTRASAWRLSTSLNGGKDYVLTNNEEVAISGIREFSAGLGHSWQFYKHFGEKFGIYGGPNIDVIFSYEKQARFEQNIHFTDKNYAVEASLSLTAGAYYKLNERWWLLGSLGISRPLAVTYTKRHITNEGNSVEQNTDQLAYGFQPTVTFPSVSLGLRYFFRN